MPMPAAAAEKSVVLTGHDQYLFREGTHSRLYEKLGAHFLGDTTYFGVWAPNAQSVSVVGDWNGWDERSQFLESRGPSGIWEGFIPDVHKGMKYKYHIRSRHNNYEVEKADPIAIHNETPPQTASIVWDLDYEWNDDEWMRTRASRNGLTAPLAIYELHLG